MKHLVGIIVALILLSGSVYGAQQKVPFNLGEVMEGVAHHPRMDGDRITIGGQVYEALFDGSGVILTSKDGKHSYRIPIGNGTEPYIRDGKVCYQTPEGEIHFTGSSRGLRYQRIINDPGFGKYLGDMVIGVKGQGDMAHPKRFGLSDALGHKVPYSADQGNLWISQKNLTSLAFPLALDGEFLIDTATVYVPAPDDQRFPSVAFDGTDYLVVWEDYRSGSDRDIYGARVAQSGDVLDIAGIVICTAANDQRFPSVAFDGTNYLVVWEDYRSGSDRDIYGARVAQSGDVLDMMGIAISTAANDQRFPSIAFDGTNYLVVWEDYRSGSDRDIYGARVDQSGDVLDMMGIAISTAANDQWSPSVAFDGANYLVVWEDRRSGSDRDIYGARVAQSGVVLDPGGIAISTAANDQWSPSVAFDGANYLVVWEDRRSGSDRDIYGARVDQSGVVLDTAGIAITTAADYQWSPSVAFDGTNYLVVWEDYRSGSDYDIYGARMDQSGVVLDTAGIAITTAADDQWSPSVAFDGTNYLVVWEDYRSGSYSDIYGARVAQSGDVLDSAGIAISTAASSQESPSVAFDGTDYMIVWGDSRNGSWGIYGARVAPLGEVLDPAGIAISTAANNPWLSPSVAFDGTDYLVVWEDYRNNPDYSDIYGARVDQSGSVLDPAGIAISIAADDQWSPSVAFDGTNYLVVWMDYRSDWWDADIYGARVAQSGDVLNPSGIAICTAADRQRSPSVAFDGTNYLVVWEDYRSGWGNADIYGARVAQSGDVLDPAGIAICTAADWQCSPSVAFDGTNYLVVWTDYRSGPDKDIYGARVAQSGEVLDPAGIAICTAADWQCSPSVAFDGTNYLVVWEDRRSGLDWDIYGARVDTSGTVIESFPVSLQSGNQFTPALAHGTGDQSLVTYTGWTKSINGKPANTMRIWGKFYPFTGVEEEPGPRLLPQQFTLEQNYPNPFNANTVIRYSLLVDRHQQSEEGGFTSTINVSLKLYNTLGQEVRTLVDEEQPAGNYRVLWDGRDNSGKGVSSGVYFCRLKVKGDRSKVTKTRKMVLIR